MKSVKDEITSVTFMVPLYSWTIVLRSVWRQTWRDVARIVDNEIRGGSNIA